MSKVLKGVLIYTFIIIAILLVLSMLILGIMFLTANSNKPFEFFGLKALHKTRVTYDNAIIQTSAIEPGSEINLIINSGNFKLNVTQSGPDGTANIVVKKYDDLLGIYKGDYAGEVTANLEVVETPIEGSEEVNKTYFAKIDVTDVKGLISYGKSVVNVILPTDKSFKYNVEIVANNGNVNIDGAVKDQPNYGILINNLKVETNRGNFAVNKLTSLVPADKTDGITTLGKIYFKTNGGIFDLSKIEKLNILEQEVEEGEEQTVPTIEIDAERGDFTFKNVTAPMSIFGSDVRIKANVINTRGYGFTFDSPKGFFKISEILTEGEAANTISTNVVDVEIEKISGETSISTTYGNINVNTLNNNSRLTSVNGNITVGVANENITAISKFGDINIASYKKLASINNQKGSIFAKYTGERVLANVTEVENNDGKTTLENIYAPLTLKVVGDGNATVTFDSLAQDSNVEHKITLTSGEAKLKVKLDVPFRIKVKGIAKGTLGSDNIAEQVTAKGQNVIIPIFSQNNNCLININSGNGKVIFESII